ncbi:protein DEHYDRATION-INDUCED 19 homolog 4-like [Cynara cardunculus var. scolymus]|uniref:protein DEHYDRATION-INDUCED 19 homolog 4-like n=1 Tax=Cynara cardunculus var. scolymus TaxID=59895 RepID=UPI000D629A13|nr:protein DEHYDRATION-INDUCED 19 homolog 4-like [Cynara cardunculus var. scolymus]
MDSDSWTRLSTSNSSSRRYQSRSEAFHLVEEFESDEEARPEFLCPFCAEDFDIVGLCCHIDEEHTVEAKNGICPVCVKRVGMDLISHITMQHASLLKVQQRKRRFHRGGGAISILKKELREQSLVGGSSSLVQPSNNVEPEPWLSSFISNTPSIALDQPPTTQPPAVANSKSFVDSTDKDLSQRSNQKQKLSDKDQEEKVRRSEFVQGLLFSTFFDDAL